MHEKFKSFHAIALFLYLLRTLRKLWLSDIFKWVKKETSGARSVKRVQNKYEFRVFCCISSQEKWVNIAFVTSFSM